MCNETSKLLALKQELSKVDKELETKKKEVCDRLKVTEERKEALQKKQEEVRLLYTLSLKLMLKIFDTVNKTNEEIH